jgi:oligosaccharide repeat unit polymerase
MTTISTTSEDEVFDSSTPGIFDDAALGPGLNVIIVACSTAAAIALVPANVEPKGALRLSSFVLAIGLSLSMILKVTRNPTAIFHPLNVLAVSPVYWLLLDQIQGAYELIEISVRDVILAYLCIGLFSIGVWLADMWRPWPLPPAVTTAAAAPFSGRALFGIAVAAFVLALLRFAIPVEFNPVLLLQGLLQDRWAVPWTRGAIGGWDAFLDHLSYFGYMLPTLTVLIGRQDGWGNGKTLTTLAFSLLIAAFLASGGGRRIIGVLAGSAFAVWFLTANPPRLKHVLVTAGLVGMLLVFMQLMLIYRNMGVGEALATGGEVLDEPDYLHVDDNFLRVCQLVNIIPERHPHVGWRWVVWVLVRPVPRVFWPGKPMDPGFDLPTYLGQSGVSLSTSVIGELYMAFGLFGCAVGGWVMGRIAVWLKDFPERFGTPGALVLFGSGLLALFAGMRSGIELILMSYASLAWVALAWVWSKFLPEEPHG